MSKIVKIKLKKNRQCKLLTMKIVKTTVEKTVRKKIRKVQQHRKPQPRSQDLSPQPRSQGRGPGNEVEENTTQLARYFLIINYQFKKTNQNTMYLTDKCPAVSRETG